MTTARNNRRTAWAFGLALATAGGAAHADVLYEALRSLDTAFPYTAGNSKTTASSIGGLNVLGESRDSQSADDFVLTAPLGSAITNVTFDIAPFLGTQPNSVMVEFFADDGGRPAAAATASSVIASADFSLVTAFVNPGFWGDVGNEPGYRIGLDLSADNIVLGAGTWWVSVVGFSDDDLYSIFTDGRAFGAAPPIQGVLVHRRNGGVAHGNGFSGPFASSDWGPTTVARMGDMAVRIEGFVIPAPGGAAALALAGLVAARRRRSSETR